MRYEYNEDLEYRLQLWALWVLKISSGEFGWPASIVAILQQSGVQKGNTGFKPPYPENEIAEDMNARINTLSKINSQNAEALKEHYLHKHYTPQDHDDKKKVSRSAKLQRVKNAKLWLEGTFYAKTG